MIIKFHQSLAYTYRVKSLLINRNNVVKATFRFFNGKMLMFTKRSLVSFIYELIEIFYFPDQKLKENYEKYQVEHVFPYHVLTDIDSIFLMFLFLCKISCNIQDEKFREIIFEVIVSSEIMNRFDRIDQYWEKFNV